MADIETTSVSADGTPIVTMKIIDKESGTETPVNVTTCAEAVRCSKGTPMEVHLANLYGHTENDGIHLTNEEKANIETKTGAQGKATTAKNEAITAASLMVESAKTVAAADAEAKAIAARDAAYKHTNKFAQFLEDHELNLNNPHSVTAAQVGLGNVPNKATNDLQPTYTDADELTALKSGERLAVAFGKIAKAISTLISHIANKANPHGVTATQAGAVPSTGGTMTGNLTMNGGHIILKRGVNYGTEDEIPADLPEGGLFFKVVE